MVNNIKEFEDRIALLGANIDSWEDQAEAKRMVNFISRNPEAKNILVQYQGLDSSIHSLKDETSLAIGADLKHKLKNALLTTNDNINNGIDKESNAKDKVFLYYIFNNKIFPILACVIITLGIFRVFYEEGEADKRSLVASTEIEQVDVEKMEISNQSNKVPSVFFDYITEATEDISYYNYAIEELDEIRMDSIERTYKEIQDINYIIESS